MWNIPVWEDWEPKLCIKIKPSFWSKAHMPALQNIPDWEDWEPELCEPIEGVGWDKFLDIGRTLSCTELLFIMKLAQILVNKLLEISEKVPAE